MIEENPQSLDELRVPPALLEGEQLREDLVEILWGELTYKNYLSIPQVRHNADITLDKIQALIQPMIDKAVREGRERR